MNMSRRRFTSLASLAALAPATSLARENNRNPIGVSTYSYWGFQRDEFRDIGKCIDLAAKTGFDGVEILQVQMEGLAPIVRLENTSLLWDLQSARHAWPESTQS